MIILLGFFAIPATGFILLQNRNIQTYLAGEVAKTVSENLKADFTVVGEASGLKPLPKAIILGEKGRVEIKIVTNGISGHASVSSLGKNAIYMMSELIQNLDQM